MVESKDHLQAKERIQRIARSNGYIAEFEIPFWCFAEYHNRVVCYTADIYIGANGRPTSCIVEIDGYKGHSSRYQSGRDERRTKDIQALWGDNIIVHRFTLDKETGLLNETDQEIEEKIIERTE